jgi:inosine-uridine nucleoside N-ribohydrolase
MTEHVWLDCDPGHDDAFAILLASYAQNINLIGISTVAGNQLIEKTTRNALNVLNLIGCLNDNGLSFPLLQGTEKPLMRKGVICDEIHGNSLPIRFYIKVFVKKNINLI